MTVTQTPPDKPRNPWETALSKWPVTPDTTHPDTSHTVRNNGYANHATRVHTTGHTANRTTGHTTGPGRTTGTRPDRNPQTNYQA